MYTGEKVAEAIVEKVAGVTGASSSDGIEGVKEIAKEVGRTVAAKGAEKAGQLKRQGSEGVSGAAEIAKEKGQQVKEAAKEKGEAARESAVEKGHKVCISVYRAADCLLAQAHPVHAVRTDDVAETCLAHAVPRA